MTPGYRRTKRYFDVAIAVVALLLSAPLQVVIGLQVRRNLGSPVLFRQPRPGLNGRIFELRKFRTMREPEEARGWVTDEERITPFGTFLRSTSLDELPSLWNVLRGDMSLIGPRPLLVRYLDRYTPMQMRRHEVRPGITGLAQISGRNSLSWDQKFALDVEYVDTASLRLDVRILVATFLKVVKRDGISATDHATMPEFEPMTDPELAWKVAPYADGGNA